MSWGTLFRPRFGRHPSALVVLCEKFGLISLLLTFTSIVVLDSMFAYIGWLGAGIGEAEGGRGQGVHGK